MWEYSVRTYVTYIDQSDFRRQELLNAMGQDGWELVSVQGVQFYFKRLKQLQEPDHGPISGTKVV